MNQQSRETYFHRVARETPTKLWINNATPEQAAAAFAAGAVGASTNPTYPAKLPAEYLNPLIDEAMSEFEDVDRVAEAVYQKAVARLQRIFHPLYQESGGRFGYVAIQGDPRVNDDPEEVIAGALRYRRMGENIIPKMPATPAGAVALEELTAMGHPTIATLGFSVDQAIYMAEAYQRGLRRTRTHPICLITFIAGILEDYLKREARQLGGIVAEDLIEQASCHGHRVAYRIFRQRGYQAVLIGGGARGARHFTEFVGGDYYITIGWELVQELVKTDGPIVPRADADVPKEIIAELDNHLPDFTKSYQMDSLRPEEFRTYGPVAMFQSSFLAGVDKLMQAVRERRSVACSGRER